VALKHRRVAECLAVAVLTACADAPRHTVHLLPRFESVIPLPAGFPPPPAPADNPLTREKIELGRHLFYDTRLSLNRTQSCASCHQQELAFSDRRPRALGSTGEEHFRNSMGLANVAYRRPLTWANRDVESLEEQVLIPLLGRTPVELGFAGHEDELLKRLRAEELYLNLFAAAFPREREPVTLQNLARAVASFERSLLSGASPYDRFVAGGDSRALSDSALRGLRLFFSESVRCSSCHGGPDLATPAAGSVFQNNGLYDYSSASVRPRDRGLRDKTGQRRHTGLFRIPSLRNVAATAPYMHDGSVATLTEVIDDYAAGGRHARLARKRPRGARVRPFRLDAEQERDLVAFLESLTDTAFFADERFSDPWK